MYESHVIKVFTRLENSSAWFSPCVNHHEESPLVCFCSLQDLVAFGCQVQRTWVEQSADWPRCENFRKNEQLLVFFGDIRDCKSIRKENKQENEKASFRVSHFGKLALQNLATLMTTSKMRRKMNRGQKSCWDSTQYWPKLLLVVFLLSTILFLVLKFAVQEACLSLA